MTLVPITPRRCYVCDRWVGEDQAERFALIDPERDPAGEIAAVSLEARRSGDYGPCWRVGERGDVSLVHYW